MGVIPDHDILLASIGIEVGRFRPSDEWGIKGTVTIEDDSYTLFLGADGGISVFASSYSLSKPSDVQSLSVAGRRLLQSDDVRDANIGAADAAIFVLRGVGTLPRKL